MSIHDQKLELPKPKPIARPRKTPRNIGEQPSPIPPPPPGFARPLTFEEMPAWKREEILRGRERRANPERSPVRGDILGIWADPNDWGTRHD